MNHATLNLPALPARISTTRRAGRRSLVELASRGARGVPAPRLRAVARDRAQPGADAGADPAASARGRGGGPGLPRGSTTAPSRRSTTPAIGAEHLVGGAVPAARRASRSPTSRPSSRCISRCRSTPAASACWPATTARKRATSACRSIGVGFMYPQGYFHQHVSAEGWQEESYERLNWADAPIEPATTPDGKPCVTAVPLGDRSVLVAVWRVRIGRVKLYLLDTDLEENAPWDRELSARLYGGDRETRDPAGDHPRHRRRARAEGARHRSRRCFTSTRATRRSSCCSGSAI